MEQYPIVDSHIHLFPSSEIRTCAWHHPGHPLDCQHSVEQYRAATATENQVRGFVFLETDRISHAEDPVGWQHALEEVAWLGRIASGQPRPGEGHTPVDATLCLAIVPWAPMPAGPKLLNDYINKAMERVGKSQQSKITGFRYLLQDKPTGTMLSSDFIESLRLLGKKGFCFDLGVDYRSGGLWQLDEAIEMIRCANEGVSEENRVNIIINHMCKPDMLNAPFAPARTSPELPSFRDWRDRMGQLAAFPNTYMKLSGGFSEIKALPKADQQLDLGFWSRHTMLARTTEHIDSWASEALRLWGASRCMFASDWPVSNIGGGGNSVAWQNWKAVVAAVISHLPPEEKKMIWAGTAEVVYKITLAAS